MTEAGEGVKQGIIASLDERPTAGNTKQKRETRFSRV